MKGSVSRRRDNADSLHDLLLANHELEFVGLHNRCEIALEVARGRALVRMSRVIVLSPLYDVACLWKRELERASLIAERVAARVIEMKMSVDHDRDVVGRDTDRRQAILEPRSSIRACILDSVDVEKLLVFLVAGACVDQHQSGSVLDQQASHAELNPVALVRRNAFLPERLGHDTEHRTAVELLSARLNRVHRERADLSRLYVG